VASVDHGDEPLRVDWLIVGGGSGQRHRQGVAFFFKRGGRTPKAGGCRLDGVEWSEMPAAPARAISYLQQRG